MAKSNSGTAYKCTIFAEMGQHTINKGELLEVNDGVSIKFKYKKPRSSRYAIQIIAWEDLIFYSATSVSFKTPKAPVKTYGSATVETDKNNMTKLYTDEGETVYVKPQCLQAISDGDDVQTEIKNKEKIKKPAEKDKKKDK